MSTQGWRTGLSAVFVAALAAGFALTGGAAAVTFKTLYAFCSKANCVDGASPVLGLTRDSNGVLYGVANLGGKTSTAGSVYALNPNNKGGYDFQLLYSFCQVKKCKDGSGPASTPILDTSGNLYGVTGAGGKGGNGTVYELIPNADRTVWTHVTLYSFCPSNTPPCPDGNGPIGSLAYAGSQTGAPYDGTSPLYGVTSAGGNDFNVQGAGVLFQLRHVNGKVQRKEKVLYVFCSQLNCTDGVDPFGLTIDANGNLYGPALGGGSAPATGGGLIYKFAPKTLKQTVLYTFCTFNGGGSEAPCLDGKTPVGPLEWDAQGRLYGTTTNGGGVDKGVLFRIAPNGVKSTEEVLRNFCAQTNCTDGAVPYGGVALDSHGNLFGTTAIGNKYPGANCAGSGFGCGTLFEVKGTTYKVLHQFCVTNVVSCPDGGELLYSSVFVDQAGNIFGTAPYGGAHGYGTVWEYTP